jgi:hypothetical protein
MARRAYALATLLGQVDALYPTRSKTIGPDGWIASPEHRRQSPNSDHNENADGVVAAQDISHDPAHGFDSYKFADLLLQKRDPRIRYVISNSRIAGDEGYARRNGGTAWRWAHYDGDNPHNKHVHISVNLPSGDDARPWDLGAVSSEGWKTSKGSWYSQNPPAWIDREDEPNSNALGVPDSQQGIALPERATLGKWFITRAPNGWEGRAQQTDLGPHPRTGRGIDISAALAAKMGYTPNTFPTDGLFSWRPEDAVVPMPRPPSPSPDQPQEPSMPALPWATIIPLILRWGPQVFTLLPIISQIVKDWPKIKAASPEGLGKLDIAALIEQLGADQKT